MHRMHLFLLEEIIRASQVILDAIRVALGDKTVNMPDFNGPEGNIIIGMELEFAYEDLKFASCVD